WLAVSKLFFSELKLIVKTLLFDSINFNSIKTSTMKIICSRDQLNIFLTLFIFVFISNNFSFIIYLLNFFNIFLFIILLFLLLIIYTNSINMNILFIIF